MRNNSKIHNAIIKTLSYSDVFDYPLRKRELWKFLNTRIFVSKDSFSKVLSKMTLARQIGEKNGYYFLIGRRKIISTRLKREEISNNKLEIAKKGARILSFIPTIKLIGISGSLSLKNASRGDDIDFFIITEQNSLWITRFLVNVLLMITGYKRSVKDSQGMDLICPNLYMSESKLSLPLSRRNLFSARETAQLRILFERENTYKKFLAANFWIKNFLWNIKIPSGAGKHKDSGNGILGFFDRIFYALQFLYMSNRITGEEIRRGTAYFHPQDKGKIILKIYKMRYKRYLKDILQDIDNKLPFLYI